VDIVITTRELVRMIRQAGIDFHNLEDEVCDHILGDYSGAGTIFGATGGVMEAALRTTYYVVTGENLNDVVFEKTRGLEGVKESTVHIKGSEVKIAVAHGLANVKHVMNRIRDAIKNKKPLPYHFIEVMACPGGCVGGGGQPYMVTDEIRRKRAQGLYSEDEAMTIRCSHDNPYIQQLYKEFLGEPLGKMSHELLHTKYKARTLYQR
jgi:NADP-reducing hydrogenase subunit HndD